MNKRTLIRTISVLCASAAMLMIAFWVTPGFRERHGNSPPVIQGDAAHVKGESTGLELEINLSRKIYRLGTSILLQARFHNTGTTPLTIVKMVDGSLDGKRYPKYTIHVVTAEGQVVPNLYSGSGCGNVNSLFEGDVAQVLPQQWIDPFEPIDEYHFRVPVDLREIYDLSKPGKYRVWLEYSYTLTGQLRVVKCVYQSKTGQQENRSSLERIRRLHVPVPDILPLQVDRLKSNEVIFEVVS